MRRSRPPLGLIVPAALAVLVVTLAVLQYRWLGQVSDAERERMKTTLMQRADAFARDFDREVLHLYLALQTESAGLAQHDWAPFARRYEIWRESAEYPQLVKGIYFVEEDGNRSPLLQYRPEAKSFEPGRPSTASPSGLGRSRMSTSIPAAPAASMAMQIVQAKV